PSDRAARRRAPAEESLEDISQTTEAAEATSGRRGVLQGVAAHVDDAPLVRGGQHLVGGAVLLELRLGDILGVDVGMQLAGQLAVRALDLRIARVPAHAEQSVII